MMMMMRMCRPSATVETGSSVTRTEDADDKTSSDVTDKDKEVEEMMDTWELMLNGGL